MVRLIANEKDFSTSLEMTIRGEPKVSWSLSLLVS